MDKSSIIKTVLENVNVKMALRELETFANSKGVYVEFYLSKGYIILGYIKRDKSAPKGVGGEVITRLKEVAKGLGMPVGLDVDAGIIDRTVQDRLINYYRQHGFEFNSAEFRRDPDLDVFMTSGRERKPMMYWEGN